MILAVTDVSFRYPGMQQAALAEVNLSVDPGAFVGMVGPNGCGKTTLIRLIAGALAPTTGQVQLMGRGLGDWSRQQLARCIAVVSQLEERTFPLRVRQFVQLGRYPHLKPMAALTEHDHHIVEQALGRSDSVRLEDRWVGTLSGGEWQRVRIARALAQQPQVLVLDEPTANLDVRHEMQVFELVADLVSRDCLTAVMVTHHVNLAARFTDQMVILSEGRVRIKGTPSEVLRQDVLEGVFQWPIEITSMDGVPQFVPRRNAGP